MVFSNLQPHEKDAFFNLLDEYFSARPEIFAASTSSNNQNENAMHGVQGAAASAMHRAMVNNPEATAKVMSAGLRHAANSASRTGTGVGAGSGSGTAASDNDAAGVAGRVAAASMAFSARNTNSSSPSSGPPPIAEKPSTASSHLASVRKFGDQVDTSSAKNFFGSLRNSSKPTPPPQISVPPAFTGKQSNFGPPPVRRVVSGVAPSTSTPEPPPPAPRRQPTPEPEQEEEEEVGGEWAEVLYDYNSGEAGDLKIKEGERLVVTERTSDDWWAGEVGGRKGLFPASYVKIL
ncbi:hypothetical protein M413DRAFT_444503 [Hebeloma cylindrosporum]|uniref:SH3 domain-containing protein n=1 Tax=Hebeloma cylindrosporum TaxID=76867 RepID=A0A0C2XYZ8_HEBCY|nr:hypothetical protein M413DRAFT_444503 [Hebeloma cylindrosporum h7]